MRESSAALDSAPVATTSHLVAGCVAACVVAGAVVVVAGLVDATLVACAFATSCRRLIITSFFDAGFVVGLVVAATSELIVKLLTCAASTSNTFLSRMSSGFLLIVSITVAATFAITGDCDVVTRTF